MSGRSRRDLEWPGWLEALEGELAPGAGLEILERVVTRVLDNARLERGWAVVDLGAGTGLLTLRASRAVGPPGMVTAVDASPDCLAELAHRAEAAGLNNIRTARGMLDALPLAPASFDSALCRSALSYVDDLPGAVLEIRRVLRPGGRFSVFEPLLGELEWDGRLAECEEQFRKMEEALKSAGGPRAVTRALLRDAFTSAGLEHDSLVVHYSLSDGGRTADELAREYLYDLPGPISAFTVLKDAGFAEEEIMEVAVCFGRAASRGDMRGRLACLFVRGARRV